MGVSAQDGWRDGGGIIVQREAKRAEYNTIIRAMIRGARLRQ